MKRLLTVIAVAAVAAIAAGAPSSSAADKDCADFKTWRQAQSFFIKHGGPFKDPHRLDGDHDGTACERLLRRY